MRAAFVAVMIVVLVTGRADAQSPFGPGGVRAADTKTGQAYSAPPVGAAVSGVGGQGVHQFYPPDVPIPVNGVMGGRYRYTPYILPGYGALYEGWPSVYTSGYFRGW